MSTGSYDILQYLVDRAHIHDTITNLASLLNCRDWNGLAERVFASDEVAIDFKQIYGGEVYKAPGAAQADAWKAWTESLTSCQLVTAGILADLPQPGDNVAPPQTVKASANVISTNRRDSAMGDNTMHYGAVYTYELTREVSGSANPWRIMYLHADLIWIKGNREVVKDIA
ncbi:hypothetical protein BV22DRAFT_188654 [Leucogyrophana mollusca]|uniref:Uncharacterized protein n=1 Tax=Leucogyrophana mollusca TaxID=85980 RepID=A0ACB8BVS2_9AGAM|nr:hypothetical protein BV22DRAFT_188654 [Leucogyrophana mollusca]